MISRHFLTSGFDKTRHWEGGDEIFSKPVRLLDYLKCLFGESNYEKNIKNCKPDNVVDGEDLETAFKDAYVYFTHFVRAKDGSVVTDRCALAALCRGMAFQCCPNQVSIDIVISVVFKKSLDEPLRPSDITFFAVQVKNKIDQSVVFVDLEKLPVGEGVKVFSDSNSKIPYIVLSHRNSGARNRALLVEALLSTLLRVRRQTSSEENILAISSQLMGAPRKRTAWLILRMQS